DFRSQQTYDEYADEYANQNADTTVGGFMTTDLSGATLHNVRQIDNTVALTLGTASGYIIYLIPSNGDGNADVEVWGQIDMNSNKIVNLTNPSSNQDAATKYYVDTEGPGDDLGDHTATQNLAMAGYNIDAVRQVSNTAALTLGTTSGYKIFLIPSAGDNTVGVEVWGDMDLQGYDLNNAGNLTGTKYWSCSGTDFKDDTPNTDYINYELATGYAVAKTLLGTAMVAPVHLPHGATITAVIVYGTSAAESWNLIKGTHQSGTLVNVASANVETEDTSIAGNPVNNQTNFYFFKTSVINQNEKIEGARIKYTI
ncbi:hypothetical protein LCGC14_2684420, partial [marine sediment metagenome]